MARHGWLVMFGLAVPGCGAGTAPAPDGPAPQLTVRAASLGCLATQTFTRAAVNRADGAAAGDAVTIVASGTPLDLVPGDAVTAVDDHGDVQTVLGAAAGDVLTFGDTCGPANLLEAVTVTWPSYAGATSYAACTSCECQPASGAALSAMPFLCDDADPMIDDVLVIAQDASGPRAFAWRPGVAVSAGATLVAGPWQATASLTVEVAALPGAAAPHVVSSAIATVVDVAAQDDTLDVLPATITRAAAPAGPSVIVATTLGPESIVAAVPPGARTSTVAVADHLPTITAFAFDPTTRRVTFTLDGTAAYDAAVVELVWALGGGLNRSWRVVVPPGVTAFVLPTHPALPETTALAGPPSRGRLSLVERADLATYDAVRGVPLMALRNARTFVGAAGVVRWTTREM